jgi:hypothetical protein
MEPLKVLVALAWGVLLGAAGLSIADKLFPQPVSVSPAISAPAEPERQGATFHMAEPVSATENAGSAVRAGLQNPRPGFHDSAAHDEHVSHQPQP